MNPRTTLFLALLVAALGAWWWLRDDAPATFDPGAAPLVGMPLGPVDRIELGLATREACALARDVDSGEWRLVEPLHDLAETSVVQEFLNVLESNPRFQNDPAPSAETLARLGLEPPRARVSLLGGERPFHLRVGERDATRAWVHVMVEGDEALYRTGANLANFLERPRREWQSRRFAHADPALVRSMTLRRPGKPPLVFEKSGVDWLLREPIAFPAGEGAKGLLGLLQAGIRDLVAPATDATEAARRGLADTATVLELDIAGRPLELRFGLGDRTDEGLLRYAQSSERDVLVVVSTPALAWLDKDEKEFRDPDVVTVTASSARRVRLFRDGQEAFDLRYDPTERRFRVEAPFAYPAASDRTSPLFHWFVELNGLAADTPDPRARFTDLDEFPAELEAPLAALGLDPPRARLEIERVEGQGQVRTLALDFGAPAGDGTVPVRRPDRFPEVVYHVPEARAAEVLGADPRTFLEPALFDGDLLNYREVTLTHGEARRTIRRDPVPEAPVWRDVADPRADTAAIQEFISTLPQRELLRILPRDPRPEDGLDAPAATLTIGYQDSARPPLELRFGAAAEGKKTVFATASTFPRRTLLELDASLLEDLKAALAAP